MRYGNASIGCWGDSTFGHTHVRKRLSIMVRGECVEVADMLLDKPSDDLSEEDEAIEILNEQCNDGVFFDFIDGDLVCVTESGDS